MTPQSPLIPSIIIGIALICSGWVLANKQITTINTLPANGTIQAIGEWYVKVSPDMVVLSLSISSKAPTSREAYANVNSGMTLLRNILKEEGVIDTDIQTTSIYMSPEYTYDNGKNIPNGFAATHSLSIKTRKMESVNALLDKVANVENVQIQGVSYDLSDKEKVYTEARKLALEKARQKATEIADVSGLEVKKVQSIAESTPTYVPMYQNYKSMDMANVGSTASTTIAPGQLEYSVSLNVVYELK